MKNLISISILIASTFIGGCHDRDRLPGVQERPSDVVNVPLCVSLYKSILNLFPESRNNQAKYPSLFEAQRPGKIVVTTETDVFVTFIGEGASRSNTLGWYSYQSSQSPGMDSNLKLGIIFPHISNSVLRPGDTRKLGRFPAGTVIGFYLIVDGWNASQSNVDFSSPIIYSDPALNDGGVQQSLVFEEKNCNDIVMGFEDLKLSASDKDFNDILFKVSDNNQQKVSTSFDMSLIPSL